MFLDCFSRRAPCKNDFEDKKNRQIVLQSIETKLYGLFLSLLFPDPSPSGSSYQPAHSRNCYYTCDLKATCVCDALFGTHRCWCLDGYVGSGHTGKCRSKFTTNSINKNQTQILKDFLAGGGGGGVVYDRLVDHLPHKRLVTLLHCDKGGQPETVVATRRPQHDLHHGGDYQRDWRIRSESLLKLKNDIY